MTLSTGALDSYHGIRLSNRQRQGGSNVCSMLFETMDIVLCSLDVVALTRRPVTRRYTVSACITNALSACSKTKTRRVSVASRGTIGFLCRLRARRLLVSTIMQIPWTGTVPHCVALRLNARPEESRHASRVSHVHTEVARSGRDRTGLV